MMILHHIFIDNDSVKFLPVKLVPVLFDVIAENSIYFRGFQALEFDGFIEHIVIVSASSKIVQTECI